MHPRLGSATLSQLAFPGEGNPNFQCYKFNWDHTVVKGKLFGTHMLRWRIRLVSIHQLLFFFVNLFI